MIEVHVFERKNLKFSAPDLGGSRTKESFEEVPADTLFTECSTRLVNQTLLFLEKYYWPESVRIILEKSAQITFDDGVTEEIPLSLITTQQQPKKSEIRMGMFELTNNLLAFKTILAHELGHMLIEWPCRQIGLTSNDEFVISHWEKSIYEGIADWFASVLTEKTTLGSPGIWFSRDILRFSSIDQARSAPKMLLVDLERGLISHDFIKKYRAYREWMELIRNYIEKINDPYAEGTWVAGQLWMISNGKKRSHDVAKKIIELAVSGVNISDPVDFISRIKN